MNQQNTYTTETAELLQTLFKSTDTTAGDEFFLALTQNLGSTLKAHQVVEVEGVDDESYTGTWLI